MDIAPSTDVDHLNRIANHPAVRPYLGCGADFFDMGQIFSIPGTICLMGEKGGFIFYRLFEGLYSIHCLFLPEGRGGKAVRAAMDAVAHVFKTTDAKAICTEIPVCNPGAVWLARRTGFTQIAKRDQTWVSPDGSTHDMLEFVLTRPNWETITARQQARVL